MMMLPTCDNCYHSINYGYVGFSKFRKINIIIITNFMQFIVYTLHLFILHTTSKNMGGYRVHVARAPVMTPP